MLKTQYPTDYLKKEEFKSQATELPEEQFAEQTANQAWQQGPILKRFKRSNGNQVKINAPADGSCLFWAVALAYLIPVKNNDILFQRNYEALFGNGQIATDELDNVRSLIQNYNPLSHDISNYTTFTDLVTNVFCNRVVDHISINENNFRPFIVGDFHDYLNNMRNSGTWGDETEIRAISEMLSANINVSGTIRSPYENGNIQIRLFHVDFSGMGGARNHYNFGLEQGIANGYIQQIGDNYYQKNDIPKSLSEKELLKFMTVAVNNAMKEYEKEKSRFIQEHLGAVNRLYPKTTKFLNALSAFASAFLVKNKKLTQDNSGIPWEAIENLVRYINQDLHLFHACHLCLLGLVLQVNLVDQLDL